MRVSAVAKTIVAAVGAGVTAATVAMGDDVISSTEAINVVLAVLTALGVYVVPNGEKKAESPSELDFSRWQYDAPPPS